MHSKRNKLTRNKENNIVAEGKIFSTAADNDDEEDDEHKSIVIFHSDCTSLDE